MKQKFFKPFLLQMMGLMITQCVMITYNPLALGWFGAMTTIEKHSLVALPIMCVGLYYAMGTLGAAKYGAIMMIIMFASMLYRRKNGKVTISFVTTMTGIIVFIMEMSDWFMTAEFEKLFGNKIVYGSYYELFIILMISVAAGSGANIFATTIGIFMDKTIHLGSNTSYLSRQINQAIVSNNENMHRIAMGFKNLSYRIMDMPIVNMRDEQALNAEEMTEQIAGRVCGSCTNCAMCWGSKAEKSKENVLEMMNIARLSGNISKERLPTNLASQCINQKELILGVNHLFERARLNFIWRSRMEEGRLAVAMQLGEMADMVDHFTRPEYHPVAFDFGTEEYLIRKLRDIKVIAKKIELMENPRGNLQIELVAKTKQKMGVEISAVEKMLSAQLGQKVRVTGSGKNMYGEIPRRIGREMQRINFIEDENFTVVYGAAGKTKESERISGDNYGIVNMGTGQMLISICDGMGSGGKANKYSEITIELLEQLFKNGFGEDTALRLINSVLMLGNQWDSPLAVDIGLVDLYSGNCNFVKMGAACTFIKRGNWVECLRSDSLPMGAVDNPEFDTVTKKLYNGDYIIMVSDGMVEALDSQDKEEAMGRIIMDIDAVNPKEIAETILRESELCSSNQPKDDKTVVVLGLWDKI